MHAKLTSILFGSALTLVSTFAVSPVSYALTPGPRQLTCVHFFRVTPAPRPSHNLWNLYGALGGQTDRVIETAIQQPPVVHFPYRPDQRDWNAFLAQLPRAERPHATQRLLEAQSPSSQRLAEILGGLEPADGVSEGVLSFLRTRREIETGGSRGFGVQQLDAIIGNPERFARMFFPNRRVDLDTLADRELALRIAVELSGPPGGPRPAFIEAHYRGTAEQRRMLAQIIGFDPARHSDEIASGLNNHFSAARAIPGITRSSQMRGLIVQGFHQRNGGSLLWGLPGRGQKQVEISAPNLMSSLHFGLSFAEIQNMPRRETRTTRLEQRLLYKNWRVSSNPTLIERIRSLAHLASSRSSGFYETRVRIHNSPDTFSLHLTEAYRARLAHEGAPQRTLDIFDELIRRIRFFLDPISVVSSENRIALQSLPAVAVGLESMVSAFNSAGDARSRLVRLTEFRSRLHTAFMDRIWEEGRVIPAEGTARRQNIVNRVIVRCQEIAKGYWEAESAYADLSMRLAFQDSEAFGRGNIQVQSVSEHFAVLMDSYVQDGWFDVGYAQAVRTAANEIAGSFVSTSERLALFAELYSSVLDYAVSRLNAQYGEFDRVVRRMAFTHQGVRSLESFIDGTMKSSSLLALARSVDSLRSRVGESATLTIDGVVVGTEGVEVLNSGLAEGVLRINPPPLEVGAGDIAVFTEMPAETASMAGMMTVGIAARLSHLQLLARSAGLPNVKIPRGVLETLRSLNGKRIQFDSSSSTRVQIRNISDGPLQRAVGRSPVHIPPPDLSVARPLSFAELARLGFPGIAGPKAVNLARLFQDPHLAGHAKDGVIVPFGLFAQYAARTGLDHLLERLYSIPADQIRLIAAARYRIERSLATHPIPSDLLASIMASLGEMRGRLGEIPGVFVRSDTNVEDQDGFNGAGLNESVGNVPLNENQIEAAIRRVWGSPFTERAIAWRSIALGSSRVAQAAPSVVIMPVVRAQSSGVILSRGGPRWRLGYGRISASSGIGGAVSGVETTEEIRLINGSGYRNGFSSGTVMYTADGNGGLARSIAQPGVAILTKDQIGELNRLAVHIDTHVFGGRYSHGVDIEWAFDESGRLVILQARPNP